MFTQKRLLADLADINDDLDDQQRLIDNSRLLHKHNMITNKQLDIRQARLNKQRQMIENTEEVIQQHLLP